MRSAEQFLRKARLRWMVWRMIESAGVCAAVGAGVGLIIVPILLWRDQPALSAAIVLLITGICAGLLWALLHQPTILQTAIEIDQQFDLHDLLSTAARFDRSQDQAFAAIVLAQAAKCCGEISPNELILRRLGSRAWGGIGIISALLLTLAMFSAHPPLSQADANSTNQSANALPQSNDDSNNSMSAALVDAKPESELKSDHQFNDGKPSTDSDD